MPKRLSPSEGYYASQGVSPQLLQNASPGDAQAAFQNVSGDFTVADPYNNAISDVTLESLLSSVLPNSSSTGKASPEDQATLDKLSANFSSFTGGVSDAASSVSDMISSAAQSAFNTVAAATAQQTSAALQDHLDVQSLLPDPQSKVVEALSLDASVANSLASSTVNRPVNNLNPDSSLSLMDIYKQEKGVAARAGEVQPPQSLTDMANDTSRTLHGEIQTPSSWYGGEKTAAGGGDQMSPRAQRLYDSFHGAFPDKSFKVVEKDGQITLTDIPTSSPILNIPTNYDASKSQTGLQDMQRQLTSETDPEKQLEIAYQIKSMSAIQGAAKYRQYQTQAEQEFNVPDLTQAVATSRQLDASHPGVVASGTMSMQTDAALRELAAARLNVNKRTKDLLDTDPVLSTATSLADMTIQKLQIGATLSAKSDVAYVKNQQMLQERAAITAEMADTQRLDRIAIVKNRQPIPPGPDGEIAKQVIATALVKKQLPLSNFEQALVGMPAEDLKTFYMQLPDKSPEKQRTKDVMIYEEAKLLRGKTGGTPEGKVALDSVNLFERLSRGVVDGTDPNVPPQIKLALKNSMAAASLIPDKVEKAKAITQATLAASTAYVESQVVKDHSSNVRTWGGDFQSDPTAKAVLKQYDEKLPGKPLPLPAFISSYLNYNSGVAKADKITALRRMAATSVDAMQDSIVFSRPSPSAFVAAVDKQTAAWLLDNAGFGRGNNPFSGL